MMGNFVSGAEKSVGEPASSRGGTVTWEARFCDAKRALSSKRNISTSPK